MPNTKGDHIQNSPRVREILNAIERVHQDARNADLAPQERKILPLYKAAVALHRSWLEYNSDEEEKADIREQEKKTSKDAQKQL